MTRIIGFDPGSRITGYGVIDSSGGKLGYIASGTINADPKTPYLDRLPSIVEGVEEVLQRHQPQAAAIERVFVAANPSAALKLGQVRGIVLGLLILHTVPIYEYSPREIKKMVTGQGNAAKEQVQYMVQKLLCLSAMPGEDAADALAAAISHIRHL